MVGPIPREISRHVFDFMKTEGGFVNSSVISTKYRPSPIPSGRVQISLLLKISCPKQKTFVKIKNCVDSLCDYDYSRVNSSERKDEEEATIVTENDQSKPVNQTASDQSKLVSYTDSSSGKEEEELHVDTNFDEPNDLINFLFLKQNFKEIIKDFWFTCDV